MSEDFRYQDLATFDPEVHAAIVDELARQRNTLEMIASENFVPRAVLEAQGSVPVSYTHLTLPTIYSV